MYVINEYIVLNHRPYQIKNKVWCLIYEPLQYLPLLQGTLTGEIYLRPHSINFTTMINSNSIITTAGIAGLVKDNGVIVLYTKNFCNFEDHYLCVSYQSGINEFQDTNHNWALEGF